MKILFIQKMAGISGSEIYFMNIMPELVKKGHDCTFCCVEHPDNSGKNKNFLKHLSDNGVNYKVIQYTRPISLPLIWKLHKFIKKGKYDIVQTNLVHADLWGALIRKFLQPDICLVSVKHGYDEGFQKRHGFDHTKLTKDTFYKVSRFSNKQMIQSAAISFGLAELLVKGHLIDPDRIQTIHYGFDFSKAKVDKQAAEKYRFSKNQMVIVGRLIPVKQHHLVIELLPEIIKQVPDVKLVLVGAGDEEDNLHKQVEQLGVKDHVHFAGFQTNIHDYIYHSDISLVPSSAEGFGVVILEAWHNAKPVIAFDVPAPNEIIANGEDGYLVTPFDKNELLERILFLLLNKSKAEEMGQAGLKKLEQYFTMDVMMDKTLAMYQRALAWKGGVSR